MEWVHFGKTKTKTKNNMKDEDYMDYEGYGGLLTKRNLAEEQWNNRRE
jgi:hypothetical protein